MTVWYVDIMWASMLFGITLFTACFTVVNRAMRGMRLMGLLTTYGIGAWMLVVLPWKVAVVTWCVFAALGGVAVMCYELWARRHYAGTGRANRPLVLLQGLILWPSMLPEALEDIVVEIGLLPPSPT
ncbi:MAG: hypothetical protein MUF00_00865 [Gemmatimonadaceae bacterium]|jgi:hypothetical protein|nr:hypothetical protein [Gemmatimonadaceae bacterium]